MSVSFAKMKIKTDTSVNKFIFDYNNQKFEIEVLKYLPASDKIDLIDVALQRAQTDGIYNEVALDVHFNLNIIYLYTNINFTDKQKEDEYKLYDQLQCSGLIAQVINAMERDEYSELLDYLNAVKGARLQRNNSVVSLFKSFINDLPKNAAAAQDIVQNFDPNKYQAVVDFAKAANGGRNI